MYFFLEILSLDCWICCGESISIFLDLIDGCFATLELLALVEMPFLKETVALDRVVGCIWR